MVSTTDFDLMLLVSDVVNERIMILIEIIVLSQAKIKKISESDIAELSSKEKFDEIEFINKLLGGDNANKDVS